MNAASPETVLVINPVALPVQFALYRGGKRVREWKRQGFASEILVAELERTLSEEAPGEILYVNGPGSQMGIKLTYITLKTLELVRGIPFGAISAFALNEGRPLKAMGRLYFVKEKETIITKTFQESIAQEFSFPPFLEGVRREPDNRPDYRLPAV